MKKLSLLALAPGLAIALAIAPAVPASANEADPPPTVASERLASGNEMHVYVPGGDQTGLRAAATPIFIVLGDGATSADAALATAQSSGLADIVASEKGVLSFLSPLGESWSSADTPGFIDLLRRYKDATGEPYDREGQQCVSRPDTGEESCAYPGAISRVYVFADGGGADFVSQNVIPGVGMPLPFPDRDGNPIVPIVTPAAVWLSHAEIAGTPPTVDVDVPAFVVDSSTPAEDFYEGLNQDGGRFDTLTTGSDEPFGKAGITAGYDTLVRHTINRASLVQPGMQNYSIMDYAAEGVDVQHKTATIDGSSVEYFSYIPDTIADAKVPLVLAFHGGGNHAEFLMFSTKWPELAKRDGFIVVAVNNHVQVSPTLAVGLLDHLLAEDPRIDSSRVYATGFSMGSIKSWSLAEEYPERFAAVAPMNGAFPPASTEASTVPLPTIYFAGLSSFLPEVPHQACDLTACRPKAPNDIDARLRVLFAQNDVSENWTYDEALNPIWGIAPTATEIVPDTLFDGVSVEVLDIASTDGRVITKLGGVTNGHHEALPIEASIAWDFMSRFSRNSDGSITTTDAPLNTIVPEIVGDVAIGKRVSATPGTWSIDQLTYEYQWLRDGEPIPGAKKSTYTVRGADQGAHLSVRITASKSGFADGVAISVDRLVNTLPGRR